MKDFRVDYMNANTGRRNHRDFSTLNGAMKFVNGIGRDDCIVKQYSPWTAEFLPLPLSALASY